MESFEISGMCSACPSVNLSHPRVIRVSYLYSITVATVIYYHFYIRGIKRYNTFRKSRSNASLPSCVLSPASSSSSATVTRTPPSAVAEIIEVEQPHTGRQGDGPQVVAL